MVWPVKPSTLAAGEISTGDGDVSQRTEQQHLSGRNRLPAWNSSHTP